MSEATQAPAAPAPEAAPPPPAAAPSPADAPEVDTSEMSFAERLSAAKKSAPASDKADDKEPQAEAKPGESPAADDAEREKARAERKARIDAMAKRERENADRAAARKPRPQEPQSDEVRLPKARAAELEAIEKALSDPYALLELAEQKNTDPVKLAEAIRERISNPEKLVSFKARQEMSVAEQKLLAKIDPLIKEIESLKAERAQERQSSEDARAGQLLCGEVERASRLNPLSARFLSKHGQESFLRYAQSFVEFLPEGSGLQALQDLIEQSLENVQLAQSESSTPASSPKTPQPQAKTTTNTVTNSLASSRTAVADEEAYADLPFDERVRLAKRR